MFIVICSWCLWIKFLRNCVISLYPWISHIQPFIIITSPSIELSSIITSKSLIRIHSIPNIDLFHRWPVMRIYMISDFKHSWIIKYTCSVTAINKIFRFKFISPIHFRFWDSRSFWSNFKAFLPNWSIIINRWIYESQEEISSIDFMNNCSTPTALRFIFIYLDCINFITNFYLVKPVSDSIPQAVKLLNIERWCNFIIDVEIWLSIVEDIRQHIRHRWSGWFKSRNKQLNWLNQYLIC